MSQIMQPALGADGMVYGGPLRMSIRPRAREVGRARRWFRSCLSRLPADDADAAEAVFAEVASNAVQHGRGRVTVTVVLLGDTAHCAIRDFGLRMPRLAPPWRPDLEHGRGMVIVAALAQDWGIHRHLLGKTVWFDVPARPPVPAAASVCLATPRWPAPRPLAAWPVRASAGGLARGRPA
jgi:anti-sigma regulatory factor (Ser/Thr protein kinase)